MRTAVSLCIRRASLRSTYRPEESRPDFSCFPREHAAAEGSGTHAKEIHTSPYAGRTRESPAKKTAVRRHCAFGGSAQRGVGISEESTSFMLHVVVQNTEPAAGGQQDRSAWSKDRLGCRERHIRVTGRAANGTFATFNDPNVPFATPHLPRKCLSQHQVWASGTVLR